MESSTTVKKSPWKQCVKSCGKVVFSHFGTLLMLVLYLIMGGYLFNYLEAQNEVLICKDRYGKFRVKLNETMQRVLAISNSREESTKMEPSLDSALVLFASDVYKLEYEPGKNCTTIGQPGNWHEWNVYNSIFFCVTVVTTIGYGNICPKTKWGKINTMIYSIFGIPLMLLFLTNVGEMMARFFRFIYLNLCCCRCFVHHRYDNLEVSMTTANSQLELKKIGDKEPPPKMIQGIPGEYEGIDDEDTYVVIPITVVLVVLFAYIVLGAALFRIWEYDWDLVDGTYFSYVTLATIGFGDYVPGKYGFEKKETAIEMIVGAIYCLVGLAILSMCLNLIQDEISAKFHWLGSRIGIVEEIDYTEKEQIEHFNHQSFPAVNANENKISIIESQFPAQRIIRQSDC